MKPVTNIGKPIVVGEATDPAVAPWLVQLTTDFITAGVNVERVKPFSLVVMTKAPLTDGPDSDNDKTRPVAIPPQNMWEGFHTVAAIVDQTLSQSLEPSGIGTRLTGYRPKDYNAAVGGAPNSRHIYGDAIDVWLSYAIIKAGGQKLKDAREILRMAFASKIVSMSKSSGLGFGFGVYTNDIHIDVGRKAGTIVTWEQGKKYIDKAKKELGVK